MDAFLSNNSVSALQGTTFVSEIFWIRSRSLQRSALLAAIIMGLESFRSSFAKAWISDSAHSLGFFEIKLSFCKTSETWKSLIQINVGITI